MKRKQSKPKPATVRKHNFGDWYDLMLYGEFIRTYGRNEARDIAHTINRILAKREKELGRG